MLVALRARDGARLRELMTQHMLNKMRTICDNVAAQAEDAAPQPSLSRG
jgi:DNA-binding GntR family transcriptional regulator